MPPSSPLLHKWQTNELLTAIQTGELDPREFVLENIAETQVKHKWSRSFFIIGGNAGHYRGHSVVGDGMEWSYEVYSWQTVMTRFSRWVSEVKNDLETPDLWAELRKEAELLRGAYTEAGDNAPFTLPEQEEIERRLRELESQVAQTCTLRGPEVEDLHAKIDYLVEAARRVGRIDWLNLFVGAIACYLIAGIPPEPARCIFQALGKCLQVIGHFFGQGFPELPMSGL